MQAVSATWETVFADSHATEFKAVINGVEYHHDKISEASVSKTLMDGLSIGGAQSATLTMIFKPEGEIPRAAEIACYVRLTNDKELQYLSDENGDILETDDGYLIATQMPVETEWMPFGIFFIDTRSEDPYGWMSITAVDAMRKADAAYEDQTGTYPMEMADAVAFIAKKISVGLDERNEIAPFSIDSPTGIYTMREVLQSVAAASAGNFVITEEGKLRLVPLETPNDWKSAAAVSATQDGETVTIRKISLYPDENSEYTVGADNGYHLTAECVYATQEICNYVLGKLDGVTYTPITGTTVFLNPASELGDPIEIAGISAILTDVTFTAGGSFTADVSSALEEEIDHEFPYTSEAARKTDRKLAKTYSEIKKTVDEIALKVEGTVDEEEVQSLISAGIEGITLSAKAGSNQSTVTISANGVEFDTAIVEFDSIEATSVSADAIYGDIYASQIKLGGDMLVYQELDSEAEGGYIGYTTGAYGGAGIHMQSGGGEVVATESGAKLCYGNAVQTYVAESGWGIDAATTSGMGSLRFNGYALYPVGQIPLGASSNPWKELWASNGTIQTSDRKKKKDISYGLEKYDTLFDLLKPSVYKMSWGERNHSGLVAQDVEEALQACGISTEEFAGFVRDGENYALRYDEFIALIIDQVQRLKKRIAELEEKYGRQYKIDQQPSGTWDTV